MQVIHPLFNIKFWSFMKILISGVMGMILGAFGSEVVNSTLIEISINPYYTIVINIFKHFNFFINKIN